MREDMHVLGSKSLVFWKGGSNVRFYERPFRSNSYVPDVQNNINSVKSLLQEAETKAAASVAISQEVHNDEGLPLVEIREDLDDEGNVICMAENQNKPSIS